MTMRIAGCALMLALTSCAQPTAYEPPPQPREHMVPADPKRFRSEADMKTAFQLADSKCRARAAQASPPQQPVINNNVTVGPQLTGNPMLDGAIVGQQIRAANQAQMAAQMSHHEQTARIMIAWKGCMAEDGWIAQPS